MTRLSPQMLRMLEDVAAGFGTHGTASGDGAHAGRYATARALRKHGLLDGDEISVAGHDALAEAKKHLKPTN